MQTTNPAPGRRWGRRGRHHVWGEGGCARRDRRCPSLESSACVGGCFGCRGCHQCASGGRAPPARRRAAGQCACFCPCPPWQAVARRLRRGQAAACPPAIVAAVGVAVGVAVAVAVAIRNTSEVGALVPRQKISAARRHGHACHATRRKFTTQPSECAARGRSAAATCVLGRRYGLAIRHAAAASVPVDELVRRDARWHGRRCGVWVCVGPGGGWSMEPQLDVGTGFAESGRHDTVLRSHSGAARLSSSHVRINRCRRHIKKKNANYAYLAGWCRG